MIRRRSSLSASVNAREETAVPGHHLFEGFSRVEITEPIAVESPSTGVATGLDEHARATVGEVVMRGGPVVDRVVATARGPAFQADQLGPQPRTLRYELV